MESTKKARGRPVGTGIDDSAALDAVADELTAHPVMPPMTAMGIVASRLNLGPCLDSATRRLKRKWDKEGTARRQEARQRHAAQQMHRAAEGMQAIVRRYAEVMNSPEMVAWSQKMEAADKEFKRWQQSPQFADFSANIDKYALIARQIGF